MRVLAVLKAVGSVFISLCVIVVIGFIIISHAGSFFGITTAFTSAPSCTADFAQGNYGSGKSAVEKLESECSQMTKSQAISDLQDYMDGVGNYSGCKDCGEKSWATLNEMKNDLERYW